MIHLPVRLGVLVHLYRVRLRVHAMQELLALLGIASGVALLFAVLVANNSLAGSVEQLARGITGRATLQVAARSSTGMDERLLARIDRLRSVRIASPILELQGEEVRGPKGSEPIDFIGADPATLGSLGGSLLSDLRGLSLQNGIALPAGIASAIGVRPGDWFALQIGGQQRRVRASIVLGADEIRALAQSPFAVAPLAYAQQLAGMQGRITRIFVEPAKGGAGEVERELRHVAGSTLDVRPADSEALLAEQAAGPNNQLTGIFAAISAIVGALLAFNAMLLTMPERRRFVALLRVQGFTRFGVLSVLAFDAVVLGVAASMLGLLGGDLLSRSLFQAVPGYLQFAFPVGTQRIVTLQTAVLAFGIGVAATLFASARPAFDLYSRRPVDAALTGEPEPTPRGRSGLPGLALAAGVGLLALATVAVQIAPSTTILGVGAVVLAMLLTIPAFFRGLVRVADALSYRLSRRGGLLAISVWELQWAATRSIALIATAAIAVFAGVALEGSRLDLLGGLDQNFVGNLHTADLWVAPGGGANSLMVQPFPAPRFLSHPNQALGINAARVYQADLLDLPGRRVWVTARPPNEPTMIAPGELVSGNLTTATRELRSHGWAAVSTAIAQDRRLHVGEELTLPTPAGRRAFRLAAIITNLGWPPGAIVMNTTDYRRAWRTSEPTALELGVAHGVSLSAAKAAVQRALGPRSGLSVQTAAERTAVTRGLARQGLARLTQIIVLVLIGAIAAIAAAIAAALWQRRPRLAALRAQGFEQGQLWQGLLAEVGLLLTVGCALSAGVGLYGQLLLTRWLRLSTGFPAPYSPAGLLALAMIALVPLVALAVTAIPGYFAARVPASVSFQE